MRIEDFDSSVENAEEIHFKTTGDRNTDDWRVETLYLVKRTAGFVLYIETGMDESEGAGVSWAETLTRAKAKAWLQNNNGGVELVEKYFSGK